MYIFQQIGCLIQIAHKSKPPPLGVNHCPSLTKVVSTCK